MLSHTKGLALLVALVAFATLGCKGEEAKKEAEEGAAVKVDFPGTEEGAKALVETFLADGAKAKAITDALRPNPKDYAAVFSADADAIKAKYDAMWDGGEMVIGRDTNQTEVVVWSSSSEGFSNMLDGDSKYFPGGYQKAAASLKPGLTFYRFKFVAPGEELGMGWDGLVYLDDHWAFFPKPWRALPGYEAGDEMEMMFDSMSPYDVAKMLSEQE